MIQEATFGIEKLTICPSSKLAKSAILLCLSKDGEVFPISGFPRHLVPRDSQVNKPPKRSLDVIDAVKEAQIQTANRNNSSPSTPRKSGFPGAGPVTPSSMNLRSQIADEEEKIPPQTPVEDIPLWARGGAAHRGSSKLRKTFLDGVDTTVSNLESVSDLWSESRSPSSFGNFLGRRTVSPSTYLSQLGKHDHRPSSGTCEELAPTEVSPGAVSGSRNANLIHDRPVLERQPTISDFRGHTATPNVMAPRLGNDT